MRLSCPNCHYIGKGKYRIYPVSPLWGGAFIGLGLVTIDTDFFGYKILGTIISVYFILLGLYYIVSYFLGDKNCTICGEIATAQKSHNGNRICSNCYYIDNLKSYKRLNKYGSVFLIAYGLLGIVTLMLNESNSATISLDWLGYLILLCVGIYGLSTNFIYSNNCSQCGKTNTMIPLDTPRAQELIKEHNLSIPT